MDLSNLPDEFPVWAVVIVVLIGAFGTFSKSVAQIKGPLGAAARYWESRQVRAVEKRKTLDETINEVVELRVDNRMEAVNADMEDLRSQLKSLRNDLDREREERRDERETMKRDHARELAKARDRELLQHRYNVYTTSTFRTYEIWAADQGIELPPPEFRTFPEWLADQEVHATARNPPDHPEEV